MLMKSEKSKKNLLLLFFSEPLCFEEISPKVAQFLLRTSNESSYVANPYHRNYLRFSKNVLSKSFVEFYLLNRFLFEVSTVNIANVANNHLSTIWLKLEVKCLQNSKNFSGKFHRQKFPYPSWSQTRKY